MKKNNALKQRLQLLAGLDVKPGNLAFQIHEGNLLAEKKRLKGWIRTLIDVGKAIGSLISAWSWLSDSRLKINVKKVGKSPSGINIYEFEYKPNIGLPKGRFRGVMAQETPNASMLNESTGYLYVDYSKIDVDFVKVKGCMSCGKKSLMEQADLDDDDTLGFDAGMAVGDERDLPIIEPGETTGNEIGSMGRPSGASREAQIQLGQQIQAALPALAAFDNEILNSGRPSIAQFGVENGTEWSALVRDLGRKALQGNITDNDVQVYAKFWGKIGKGFMKIMNWLHNLMYECECGDRKSVV